MYTLWHKISIAMCNTYPRDSHTWSGRHIEHLFVIVAVTKELDKHMVSYTMKNWSWKNKLSIDYSLHRQVYILFE